MTNNDYLISKEQKLKALDRIFFHADEHPKNQYQTPHSKLWYKVHNFLHRTEAALFTSIAEKRCLAYLRKKVPADILEQYLAEADDFEGREYWLWYHTKRLPWTIDRESLTADVVLFVINYES